MKVTNISSSRIYLSDLKVTHASQVEGRPGENRYLAPGQSVYLQNTSEVLRSAYKGTLRIWRDRGIINLEDVVILDAFGGLSDSTTLIHDYGYPPVVYVLKQVGPNWVDATGTVDILHGAAPGLGSFSQTVIINTTPFVLTLLIRLV